MPTQKVLNDSKMLILIVWLNSESITKKLIISATKRNANPKIYFDVTSFLREMGMVSANLFHFIFSSMDILAINIDEQIALKNKAKIIALWLIKAITSKKEAAVKRVMLNFFNINKSL